MRAIGYIRVSTSLQATEGVSLDNQADRIRAYCQYKGFELLEIIEDAGISGGINKGREGFIRLLDRIEANGFDVIVLYSLERLSRDMLTLLTLERYLDDNDIELHTIEGQIDTSSPDGFMSFAMKAFLGEMERRQVKYRTRKAMQFKKSNNEIVGSVPYGYLRHGKDLLPDLAEQAIIRQVNDLYSQGRTLCVIVKTLNEAGRMTRTATPWTPAQVRRLFSDYSGKFKKSRTKISTAARRFIEAIA
jgi:site-specific DNA recombinase